MNDLRHLAEETGWQELFDGVSPYARRYTRDDIMMDVYFTTMKACVMIKGVDGQFVPHHFYISEREWLVELFNNPSTYKQL